MTVSGSIIDTRGHGIAPATRAGTNKLSTFFIYTRSQERERERERKKRKRGKKWQRIYCHEIVPKPQESGIFSILFTQELKCLCFCVDSKKTNDDFATNSIRLFPIWLFGYLIIGEFSTQSWFYKKVILRASVLYLPNFSTSRDPTRLFYFRFKENLTASFRRYTLCR